MQNVNYYLLRVHVIKLQNIYANYLHDTYYEALHKILTIFEYFKQLFN